MLEISVRVLRWCMMKLHSVGVNFLLFDCWGLIKICCLLLFSFAMKDDSWIQHCSAVDKSIGHTGFRREDRWSVGFESNRSDAERRKMRKTIPRLEAWWQLCFLLEAGWSSLSLYVWFRGIDCCFSLPVCHIRFCDTGWLQVDTLLKHTGFFKCVGQDPRILYCDATSWSSYLQH